MNISNNSSTISEDDYDQISNDYYHIYYEGDILNLKSVWVREPHFIPLISLYTSVFLLGITGNGLVLFAIVGSKKTRNVTFLFLLSLAMADLLFVLVCVPIETLGMLLGHWVGGRIFCKLSGFAEMLSASASILNLTTISVERYFVIVMPLKSRKNCTVGRTRRILIFVWIAAVILSTPAAIVRDVAVTTFYNNNTEVQTSLCGEHAGYEVLLLFAIYQLVIMFVLPTVIMAYCYTAVIYVLWISRHTLVNMTPKTESSRNLVKLTNEQMTKKERVYFQKIGTRSYNSTYLTASPSSCQTKQNISSSLSSTQSCRTKLCQAKDNRTNALKGRKQVVKMLVTVVGLFLLCWGPKLILQILKRLQLDFVYYPEVFQAQIGIYCLTYIQSCINPLIYGLMSKNFRLSLKYACKCIHVCRKLPESTTNLSLEMESKYSSDTRR